MASGSGFESLQLNREIRFDRKLKAFARFQNRVPAFFGVSAPFRAFDESDLSMAEANEVVNRFANAKEIVDGNSCAPYGRASVQMVTAGIPGPSPGVELISR
jgi:hypothetical protein